MLMSFPVSMYSRSKLTLFLLFSFNTNSTGFPARRENIFFYNNVIFTKHFEKPSTLLLFIVVVIALAVV